MEGSANAALRSTHQPDHTPNAAGRGTMLPKFGPRLSIGAGRERRGRSSKSVGDMERAMADSRCVILSFHSSRCKLCRALRPKVDEVLKENAKWLSSVHIDANDKAWIPEMSYYAIGYVPCFVLLDAKGRARYATTEPVSYDAVAKSLYAAIGRMRGDVGRAP